MPTPKDMTRPQPPRERTAKELRAMRKRQMERQKNDRKAQGYRSVWSLPAGREVRRAFLATLAMGPLLGAAFAVRVLRHGGPGGLAFTIGLIVWLSFSAFMIWGYLKKYPY